jgi:hypothetical protein
MERNGQEIGNGHGAGHFLSLVSHFPFAAC